MTSHEFVELGGRIVDSYANPRMRLHNCRECSQLPRVFKWAYLKHGKRPRLLKWSRTWTMDEISDRKINQSIDANRWQLIDWYWYSITNRCLRNLWWLILIDYQLLSLIDTNRSINGGCRLQVAGCRLELQVTVSPKLKQPKTLLMLTLGLKNNVSLRLAFL